MDELEAELYITFPSLNIGTYADNKEFVDLIPTLLIEEDFDIIGEPTDFTFPDSLFFDSHYHLNKQGQMKRTVKFIELIKLLE